MNLKQTVFRSSVALSVGYAANKVIGIFIMLALARYLTPEEFGLYTLVFSWVVVLSIPTDIGFSQVLTREISRDEEGSRDWIGNAVLFRFLIAVPVYLVGVVLALLLYGWSTRALLIAVSAIALLYSPLTIANSILEARMRLYRVAFLKLGLRLCLWIAVLVLAGLEAAIVAFMAVEVVIGLVRVLAVWLDATRLVRPRWVLKKKLTWDLIRRGFPLSAGAVFMSLYYRIDVFFLDHFWGSAEVGSYAAAYRLAETVPILAAAVTASIFPLICQYNNEKDFDSLVKLLRGSQKVLLAIVVMVAVSIAWSAAWVVDFLYSGKFPEAALPLTILGVGQIVVFSNLLSFTVLRARNRGRALMLVTMGMVPVNAVLNWFVVPRFGMDGAAATTVATELAGMIVLASLTGTLGWFVADFSRLVIPAAAACGIFWYADAAGILALWMLPVAWAVFAGLVAVTRFFNREERQRIRNAVGLSVF